MIVKKLFSTQKKIIEHKPVLKKPVAKSYRELLRLDRPKKKIEYEQQSEEEDFLEKMLNEERSKAKKKPPSRKNTSQNQTRPKNNKVQVVAVKREKKKEQEQPPIKKPMSDIEMFLANTKELSKNVQQPELSINPQEKTKQLKRSVKSRSTTNFRTYSRTDKNRTLKKDMAMSNPIFIDTKSLFSPPITFTSASHLFNNTLRSKQTNAYQELLHQKNNYERQYKTPQQVGHNIVKEQVQHKLRSDLYQNFQFHPNIQPLNPNWRLTLAVNPLASQPQRRFSDRQKIFKSQRQQQRFIESLRELSKLKR